MIVSVCSNFCVLCLSTFISLIQYLFDNPIVVMLHLAPSILSLLQLKKLMVVGIDTYHDTSSRGRSVGGFIASVNASLTK